MTTDFALAEGDVGSFFLSKGLASEDAIDENVPEIGCRGTQKGFPLFVTSWCCLRRSSYTSSRLVGESDLAFRYMSKYRDGTWRNEPQASLCTMYSSVMRIDSILLSRHSSVSSCTKFCCFGERNRDSTCTY